MIPPFDYNFLDRHLITIFLIAIDHEMGNHARSLETRCATQYVNTTVMATALPENEIARDSQGERSAGGFCKPLIRERPHHRTERLGLAGGFVFRFEQRHVRLQVSGLLQLLEEK